MPAFGSTVICHYLNKSQHHTWIIVVSYILTTGHTCPKVITIIYLRFFILILWHWQKGSIYHIYIILIMERRPSPGSEGECLPVRFERTEEGNVMWKQVRGRKAYPPRRDETKGARKDKRTLLIRLPAKWIITNTEKRKVGIPSTPTPHLSTRPHCIFEWWCMVVANGNVLKGQTLLVALSKPRGPGVAYPPRCVARAVAMVLAKSSTTTRTASWSWVPEMNCAILQ